MYLAALSFYIRSCLCSSPHSTTPSTSHTLHESFLRQRRSTTNLHGPSKTIARPECFLEAWLGPSPHQEAKDIFVMGIDFTRLVVNEHDEMAWTVMVYSVQYSVLSTVQ